MPESSDIARALSGVIEFTYEFIERMPARSDLMVRPSIRQTEAIPKLLSARYFRNGKIGNMDFLEVAVFTTNPEDQDIAREIAEDIILGKSSIARQKTPAHHAPPVSPSSSPLDEMIAKIKRERELARRLREEEVQAGTE